MKRNKNKKGFTIVELVIVIGVIGILSAILIPTFVSLTTKANDAALKSNLANAYSMYAAEASDGKYDVIDPTTGKVTATYDIEFRAQADVVLREGTTYYTFETRGGDDKPSWGEALDPSSITSDYVIVCAGHEAESKFGEYTFYYDSTKN